MTARMIGLESALYGYIILRAASMAIQTTLYLQGRRQSTGLAEHGVARTVGWEARAGSALRIPGACTTEEQPLRSDRSRRAIEGFAGGSKLTESDFQRAEKLGSRSIAIFCACSTQVGYPQTEIHRQLIPSSSLFNS